MLSKIYFELEVVAELPVAAGKEKIFTKFPDETFREAGIHNATYRVY